MPSLWLQSGATKEVTNSVLPTCMSSHWLQSGATLGALGRHDEAVLSYENAARTKVSCALLRSAAQTAAAHPPQSCLRGLDKVLMAHQTKERTCA